MRPVSRLSGNASQNRSARAVEAMTSRSRALGLRRERSRRSPLDHPVPGEGRDDATADQRDHDGDQRDGSAPAKSSGNKAGCSCIIRGVGETEGENKCRPLAHCGSCSRPLRAQQARPSERNNPTSRIAAGQTPISEEKSTARRAAAHKPNSESSGLPAIGSRPVQFGIAVSRNPATAAPTNPNSIS